METTSSDIVLIQTKFAAPVQKVWAAWTEPVQISKWFGSNPNGYVLKVDMDVQPGGKFEITFQDFDGTEHTCFGTYRCVQPFNELSFTWTWTAEPGVQSLVTILLSSEENSTLMQFRHANIGHASVHNYEQGWRNTFSKLEKTLAA